MAFIHTIEDSNGVEIHKAEVSHDMAMDMLAECDIWNLQVRELPDGDYTWR